MKKTNLLVKITAILLVFSMFSGMTVFAADTTTEQDPTLKIHAQTLELESNVYINYYVETDGISDLDSVKLQIWTDATGNNNVTPANSETPTATLTPINTEATLCESDSKTYVKFSFQELAAKQMTDTVYARAHVRIENTDYYSDVQKYSILQYAYNKLGLTDAEETDDESLKALLNSLLAYGASAQTYFNYATDRLATDTFYQVKTVGGVLTDGCDNGLYKTGTTLTLTAPSPIDGYVCYWIDGSGKAIANGATAEVTVGEQNTAYTAVSIPAVTAADELRTALSSMTENDTVTIGGVIAPAQNSATTTAGIGNDYDFIMTNGGVLTSTDFGKIVSNDTGAWATLIINNEANWPVSGDGAYKTTVENVTIETDALIGIYAQSIGADTYLNNVTVRNTTGAGFVADYSGATTYLNNCDIHVSGSYENDWINSAVMLERNASVVIDGGTYAGKYAIYLCSTANNQNAAAGTCTIYDGTFNGEIRVDSGTLIIYGGTFTSDPTAYLAEGCTATQNGNVWVVTNNNAN